jgi:predicted ferric reductase
VRDHPWWYVARATGITSWAFLSASVLIGASMSTKRVQSLTRSLVTHRLTAGVGVLLAIAHVAAILFDEFVDIGMLEVLVPFASVWRPGPVAWGSLALYLLVVIEVTSLLRRRLPYLRWRRLHIQSYVLFGAMTIHFLSAGTTVNRWVPRPVLIGLGSLAVTAALPLYVRATNATEVAEAP